ncbi:Long-chain-fatty-acid--CoA ligase 2 [Sparassis crispa]|uniref:Long-chain-fatty-acid--CoA ligase 2 n=1 Tax=Sparassis crispa TaxID=139825 RepID=A0A401GXA8_9APHY|nr:Long-chain-fatty-acid--CoA ligase 2 [Sparassis crispa]GBE86847.1 Long-chain-fatty-acid--CoA ligase 2 [Sparassis crispa]
MTVTAAGQKLFGKVGSVEVGPEDVQGETRIHRLTKCKDKLLTQPWEGIDTVHDVLCYAARTHGVKNAFGYREIIDVHEEEKEVRKFVGGKEVTEKKIWKYFQLSDYKYLNFIQVKEAALQIAGGLIELGVEKSDVVNVYAATSPNWQLVSYACSAISVRIATAYETLGESGLQHALNEPECGVIFTNADLLPVVANVAGNVPSLRLVIYDGEPKPALLEKVRNAREGIQVLTLDEVRDHGRSVSEEVLKGRQPSAEDVACIMYTSGTTGAPKGAVISHRNLVASVGSVYTLLIHRFKADDTYLAYLPLSHVLEYVVELSLFFVGMTFGYARVKTLMDTSVRHCLGDIRAFRPSIMVGVPAVWEMIRKGIEAKIKTSGSLRKSVFAGAYSVKKAGIPVLSEIAESTVLQTVKNATGGRLRLALCGGAALSMETQEFLSVALVRILMGYGLTESCGMCAVLPPEFGRLGSVGLPMPSVEVKLRDVPESGYFATNKPPQGEVCIRGPSLIRGYYKRDDLNNDENIFTKDGWFRTGDVGQWNEDGTLSLVDRIKNLIKLQGGEYIALERLESVYKSCNLVSNICVLATPAAKQPMAIIIPHEQHLQHALQTNDFGVPSNTSLAELCQTDKVREFFLTQCNALGKKNGFKTMELLEAVVLTAEEWTPESGLVTAAQKIQRKRIAEHYAKEIKAVGQHY